MQAIAFTSSLSLEGLAVVQRPMPTPSAHDVILRVDAVSLNYRDLAIARGEYGSFSLPLVPLSDAAGEVVTMGSEVTGLAIGDRVIPAYVPEWLDGPVNAEVARARLGGPLDGVLSDYLKVPARSLVRAPRHLSIEEAATLPIAGASAWQAVVADAQLKPGSSVAITGTGGLSLFALQVAKASGAQPFVIARDPARLERAASLGATPILSDSPQRWVRSLVDQTRGGVDLFVDVVGASMLGHAIDATRVGGTISALGFVSGRDITLDLVTMIRKAITIRATSGASRTSLESLIRTLELQAIHPVIDRVLPLTLEGLKVGLAHLAEGHPFGKIVLSRGVR